MLKNNTKKIFNFFIIILLLGSTAPFFIYATTNNLTSDEIYSIPEETVPDYADDYNYSSELQGIPTDGTATYTLLEQSLPHIPSTSNNMGEYLKGIFNLAIGVASALAVLMIVLGGFKYMTSDGGAGTTEAKQKITDALLGLVLVLASWLILNTINTDLVNFNTNLDSIPYTAPATTPASTSVASPQISNTALPSNSGITPNTSSATDPTTKKCWCATFSGGVGGQVCYLNKPSNVYGNYYTQRDVSIETFCN